MTKIILQAAIDRRIEWVQKILNLSKEPDSKIHNVEKELNQEIDRDGISALLDHLRLCSTIPESYIYDSSEEKFYAKYTDPLLSASFNFLGFHSIVLDTRSNSADIEAISKTYSFVADAKIFRLSRTAKNQKDFKISSMNDWKYGKPYAMIVCPLYQLPARNSQIYQQATIHNVCIFSYTHLSLIIRIKDIYGSKPALNFKKSINKIWQDEKLANAN